MARSSSIIAPLALLAACMLMMCSTSSFVQPARSQMAAAAPAAALLAPAAAQAIDMVDVDAVGASSVTVATQIEVTMLGLLLGLAPVTAMGLFVAAWLQFKKSPTLGV
eukprot:TRINITY_DN1054_c0_g4_i1.p2 TRINITY_DN1054_c0_g4~~TRINITY_DN1054_c0_g4_i1.p2  ORF type:complete len:126 (-),score=38.95 TRINITY_DN1054_c0_g4_i1:130-453(-)